MHLSIEIEKRSSSCILPFKWLLSTLCNSREKIQEENYNKEAVTSHLLQVVVTAKVVEKEMSPSKRFYWYSRFHSCVTEVRRRRCKQGIQCRCHTLLELQRQDSWSEWESVVSFLFRTFCSPFFTLFIHGSPRCWSICENWNRQLTESTHKK